ncbi:MAG: ATP-dependent DNA helicase RecQ [Gemmatimonadota bacterium]|nr:ATP-dependent DNA helicase RecQ [Gemmatimonadota bacterium]
MANAILLDPPAGVRSTRIARAQELLQQHFGYPDFRASQRRVIDSVLSGRDTLAVLPTGGGKSICFQVPAMVLDGFTLVISPLISLMQDQVDAACARGLPAAALNSTLSRQRQQQIQDDLEAGRLKLLYTSPERLARLGPQLAARNLRPALLAIDEAHCIAEWGHDFRPSYRTLRRARSLLGWPPTVALTGSATPEVRTDIVRALGLGARGPFDLHLGSFDRRNLWFGVVPVKDDRARWTALLRLLAVDDRVAIVYAPTRNVVEGLTRRLRREGYLAAPYHAGLSKERRESALVDFLNDRVEIIVATCAFGMGIDKPNVRLVVHWTMPATPESYYQEAGRAGRDGAFARCILLNGPADGTLPRRQLDVTFPDEGLVESVWHDAGSRKGVPGHVLASAERLARELHPERGPVDWRPVRERRRRATTRIAAVEQYAGNTACRRAAILNYFGEVLARCSGCDHCGERRHGGPLAPGAKLRLARLRSALTGHQTPWGGCILDPVALARLAIDPPVSAAALADTPGVGPEMAARLGRLIMTALWAGAAVGPGPEAAPGDSGTLLRACQRWRATVAAEQGVPEWRVATDRLLHQVVLAAPTSRDALARVPGVGPRFLLKHAESILAILDQGGAPPPTPPHPAR